VRTGARVRETARVPHAARRHGGRVAALGARAAASIAGDRNFGRSIARDVWAVIYAIGGTEGALAAKGATQIIPIVITNGSDPVKKGLIPSLNRPGGNVTGTSFFTVGLGTKRLEPLHPLLPPAPVIAVLVQTGSAIAEEQLSDLQQAANALRLRLVVLAVTGDSDLELAFAKVALEGAGALCVTAGAFFTSRRDKLAALAAQHRIPT